MNDQLDAKLGTIIRNDQSGYAAQTDAAIRRMLNKWISELDPTVVYAPGHKLIGLAGPNGKVVITAVTDEELYKTN